MAATIALDSRDYLASCLKLALEDADLVDAITEQAVSAGLNAVTISRGLLSVDSLKEQLFLTREEATKLMDVCTTMCNGPKPAAPQQLPVTVRLLTTSSGRLALRLSIREPSAAPLLMPVEEEASQAEESPVAGLIQQQASDAAPELAEAEVVVPHAEGIVVVSRASPAAAAKKAAHEPSEDELFEEPETGLQEPQPEPVTPPRPTSAPAHSAMRTPPASAPPGTKTIASPNPSTTPRSAPRPKSALPKPSALLLPDPGCGLGSPTRSTSPTTKAHVPSYLRPTAAHKARTSTEDSSVLISPCSYLPPVTEEPRRSMRSRNLLARMASTLLVPTKAFVARVTGRNEDQKAKTDVPISKASLQLDAVLQSPQGQRVTKPQPFALRAELRPKSCVLSKEELDLIEAREKAFRRNPVPKHVHEARPIVPVTKSTPKDPQELFEPFNLASLDRHNKQMEALKKKHDEEKSKEEEARRFKAREFDSRLSAGPQSPPKPVASPPTKGTAPVFASEARIAHYHAVIEPKKKAKEAEQNKEKLEEERRVKELEAMSVDDFRKTLEFKARLMPDFSAPFRPDPAMSRPVTSAAEPKLHTVARLGAAPSPRSRQDKEGDGLGAGVYNGEGYIDPFFASLRKSTSVVMSPGTGSVGKGSMRRSVAVGVRASATSAMGGSPGAKGGNNGLRVSVGSALQAAIRAAAQEAARDVARQVKQQKQQQGGVGSVNGTPTKCHVGAQHGSAAGSPAMGVAV